MNMGQSLVIKGELSGGEDLTLDGRVEGKVNLPDHVLTVGPNANIDGRDRRPRSSSCSGRVKGNVSAKEKFELRAGGTVDGELTRAEGRDGRRRHLQRQDRDAEEGRQGLSVRVAVAPDARGRRPARRRRCRRRFEPRHDTRLDAPLAACRRGRAGARRPTNVRPSARCTAVIGIDPTKTRPSSEALLRRVRKGDHLPRINTLVDICNWCSLEFQLPYGLYDLPTSSRRSSCGWARRRGIRGHPQGRRCTSPAA